MYAQYARQSRPSRAFTLTCAYNRSVLMRLARVLYSRGPRYSIYSILCIRQTCLVRVTPTKFASYLHIEVRRRRYQHPHKKTITQGIAAVRSSCNLRHHRGQRRSWPIDPKEPLPSQVPYGTFARSGSCMRLRVQHQIRRPSQMGLSRS